MTRSAEGVQFAELKGVEQNFPLVGDFRLSDGSPFRFELLENQGAIAHESLLEKLKVKIGDAITVGRMEFTIRGTFSEEPGGASGFRLGPRVFIEKKAFDEAGLTRFGSRARRWILYRTSSDPTDLVRELRQNLKGTILSVNSYKEAQENLGEQFERTENYLSLTGLLILVLGGIGVWNVARVFVEQKRKSVAVLKCLGASGTKIIAAYLLQILTLGLLGGFFGVALAQFSLWIIRLRFGESLPAEMTFGVNAISSAQGVVLGFLISLLFSVLPLLHVRSIKPNLLLRDENNEEIRRLDFTKWTIAFFSLALLLALAVWQAGSLIVGAAFLGGLAITSLMLYVAAGALSAILRRLKSVSTFSIAQAINSLYRPGNQTRVVILAVGLGVFVVFSGQFLATNLIREFDFSRNQKIPSLLLIDIQRSQVAAVKEMAEAATDESVAPIPTVRGRIALVNGEPFDFENREVRQQQGIIGREFALTYRANLDENETIIDGKFWDPDTAGNAEVSVEEGMSETIKVQPGDVITFDIMGRRMPATVTSIRKIDIRNTRTAFVFVFQPGLLEKAPQTFVVPITKKLPNENRVRFQRSVLEQFPNVQIFDIADVISSLGKLLDNFVIAVSFVGSFVILTGILILIGSVALTKSQRIYENAVMKTLGARRLTLASILCFEYAGLGLIAGLIGVLFAGFLGFIVTKFILKIGWETDLKTGLIGVFGTMILVMFIGVVASFGVLFKRPLSILRSG
jgi:putative ABC transport system permease protein